ncbi:MAG TPA: hypothetical protein ENH99_02355 [Candidatus Pacearchaeota archaeon]|nr:hypothetical protein [Candidatus Pacearchaeota archaeon]
MEKKFLLTVLILLASIPIILSIPQFLLFQGEVTIDGRPVNEGTLVNFSINDTELDSDFTDADGEYYIFIQGFSEYYGEPINVTIDGYEVEQEISYTYPQDINLNLSALTEKALRITDYSPEAESIIITEASELSFNVTTYSGYSDPISYEWFLDDISVSNTDSYSHTIENSDEGTLNLKAVATDEFLTVSKEWTLIIARPETESFDGETTDFSDLGLDELGKVPDVILEKTGRGKIEFLDDLNLTGVIDLNNKVKIERGTVAIDTSVYPQLSKPARITLSGLRYTNIPEIFYSDGFTTNPNAIKEECDFCNIISYTKNPTTDGVIVFEVEHFSSFKAGESGSRYDLSLFDDLDTCRSGIVGDLDLELKDPDEGDEFGPGEEMEVKVEVKNNADDDKKIIVEATLYNIGEDEEIQNVDDSQKVKDSDDKKLNLILEVPDDFEDDNYLVFVKAYEKGEEESQCAEGAISVSLEREKHDVIIKDFSINPSSIIAGKSFGVFTEVQNIGESDEDVYIVVEIKELGVLTEGETFELEEFGEDDFYSETLSIKIPNNAKKGEYEITIKAIFDGEEDEREETISVLEKEPIQMDMIFLNKKIVEIETKEPLKIEKKELILEKTPPKIEKARESGIPSFVPWLLFGGIVILMIMIVIVGLRRR